VCKSLVERLASQYPGQIVQILTNLKHFQIACTELQELLFNARTSSSVTGPVVLQATEDFEGARKAASDRIFELVNSKIDDLIETAEYDWYVYRSLSLHTFILTISRMATRPADEASPYMQELTRYLKNIMSSVLLALPTDIKEFIYFDALSHASAAILVSAIQTAFSDVTDICKPTGPYIRRVCQAHIACRRPESCNRHRLPVILR
jgi:hypothetical protein